MEQFANFLNFNTLKEMLDTKDIYCATKPLYYLSKVLGLAPFSYNKDRCQKASDKKLKISTLGTLHSWGMCVLISNFLIFLFISNMKKEFPTLVIDIVNISDSYFSSLSVIISYALCATVNRNKVRTLFALLSRVDKCLVKSDCSYRITGATLLMGVSIFLFAHGIGYYVVCIFIPTEAKDYHIQFVNFSIYVVGAVTIMQFVYSVLILKDRFEMLNKELLNLFEIEDEDQLEGKLLNICHFTTPRKVDDDSGDHETCKMHINKSTIEMKLLESCDREAECSEENFNLSYAKRKERNLRLRCLRGVHNVLCDAAELTNSTYQVQVLMDLIGILIEITTCLYLALTYTAQILTCRPTDAPRWNLLGLYVVWVALNLSKLLAIMISCRTACQKANHTAVLVHKLLVVQPLHSEITTELQMFSQQLLHRKLQFSACGFFNIDFTLLYSMASSMTTYLIILVQYTGQNIGEARIVELCNTTSQTTV